MSVYQLSSLKIRNNEAKWLLVWRAKFKEKRNNTIKGWSKSKKLNASISCSKTMHFLIVALLLRLMPLLADNLVMNTYDVEGMEIEQVASIKW